MVLRAAMGPKRVPLFDSADHSITQHQNDARVRVLGEERLVLRQQALCHLLQEHVVITVGNFIYVVQENVSTTAHNNTNIKKDTHARIPLEGQEHIDVSAHGAEAVRRMIAMNSKR